MSTVKDNTIANRFKKLAQMDEEIFHTQDLANLWQINNKNNLHTTLYRYVQKGLLNRIQKGMYSLKNIKNLDPNLLGVKFLNQFAYISTETILAEAGIIFQNPTDITLVSSKSLKFTIGGNSYTSRQLKDGFLYNDYGISLTNGYYKASLERAVADILYFNPQYYFDNKTAIDWKKVKEIQKKVAYIK